MAFYPQFGQGLQAVQSAAVASGGAGYVAGDVVALVQPDANNCTLTVLTVDVNGAALTLGVETAGTGYSVAQNLATTGGTGAGLTANITAIAPMLLSVPQVVMQAYILLATSCLSVGRWGAQWPVAMGMFVAHYLTLYLKAVSNMPNPTASAIAAAGIAGGILVSKAAGDVSASYEPPPGLEDAGAWGLTSYGQLLFTLAKTVGMGMVYAW